MLDDLRDIRATLARALERFRSMATGMAWDGDMTGNIDPNLCAQIVGALEGKIADLDEWIAGNWTPMEEVVVLEFVTAWDTATLTSTRFDQHHIPATMTSLPIPKRGNKDARTDLVQHDQPNCVPAPYDNSSDIKTPIEQPIQQGPTTD